MYRSSLPSILKLAEPQPEGQFSSRHIAPFPPADPLGHIYQAQVEFTYAHEMLEVLMLMTSEAEHLETMPVDGLYGLFSAVQAHVGAGRNRLRQWQEEYALRQA